MIEALSARLRSGDFTVGVVGLGYVGLPLSVEIARSGLRVIGFDVDAEVVEGINASKSHIDDVTHEELGGAVGEGRLQATTDMARLAECDAISISVPTPLSKTQDPDVSYVIAASEAVAATTVVNFMAPASSMTPLGPSQSTWP